MGNKISAPLISVVVPVYNVERYLARCLDSLLRQTAGFAYEVICIDDCSSDGSVATLDDYSSRHGDVVKVYRNEENLGLGRTRDRGLRLASADYVLFVDSDDYVRPDYLKTYHDAMSLNPCDAVVGGYITTDGAKESVHFLPHSCWTDLCFSSSAGKLYRRRFLLDNGLEFTGVRYAEDTRMNLYAFAAGMRCHVIDYAGYYYFQNAASITHAGGCDGEYEKILSGFYREFIESEAFASLSEKEQRMIEYSYIADMLNTVLLYGRGCGKQSMERKWQFFRETLDELFPDYMNSPFAGVFGPKGQRRKTRLGVAAFLMSRRLHLDKQLFFRFA